MSFYTGGVQKQYPLLTVESTLLPWGLVCTYLDAVHPSTGCYKPMYKCCGPVGSSFINPGAPCSATTWRWPVEYHHMSTAQPIPVSTLEPSGLWVKVAALIVVAVQKQMPTVLSTITIKWDTYSHVKTSRNPVAPWRPAYFYSSINICGLQPTFFRCMWYFLLAVREKYCSYEVMPRCLC